VEREGSSPNIFVDNCSNLRVLIDLQTECSCSTFEQQMFDGSSFTVKQVRAITGVPYETLNYWARIGLVSPSVSAARGSGTRRVYDFQDLVAIRVAMRLREAGVFGKALMQVLGVLRKAGFDSPANVAIDVVSGGEVEVRLAKGETMSARRRPGQLLLDFSCDCRKEVKELRRDLRSFALESMPTSTPVHPANTGMAEWAIRHDRTSQRKRRSK